MNCSCITALQGSIIDKIQVNNYPFQKLGNGFWITSSAAKLEGKFAYGAALSCSTENKEGLTQTGIGPSPIYFKKAWLIEDRYKF